MNIKLGFLVKSTEALAKLNHTEGLDAITAYRIVRNISLIDSELSMYNMQQAKLVEKYCEKENGTPVIKDGSYSINKDNMDAYCKELEALFNEDIKISIKTIKLEAIEKAGLSPAQIHSIEYMLDLEE